MNQPQDALARRVRALAVTLSATERAPMRLGGAHPGTLRALAGQVARLSGRPGVPAMEWLRDNVRSVGESALSLRRGAALPASEGIPRIQHLMRALTAGGDELVTVQRLTGAVSAFDEIQPLTMRELWRIPEALRVELCGAFESVGRRVVAAQRERVAAEDWVHSGAKVGALRAQHSGAFFERALQLTHEQEMPAARRALDQWLGRRGEESDVVIRLEHERQALDKLWLSNIMAGFRMLDVLDWASLYDTLCRAERLLRLDPSGVYPRMDEDSRGLIREEVARLARATGQSELTLARRAVDEASGLDGAQGSVCWWLYDDDGRRALIRALGLSGANIPRMTPDPSGRHTLAALSVSAAAIWILLTAFLGNVLWALPALPLAWRFSEILLGYAASRALKPRRLLRLTMDAVPDDARTLVCVPALLSGEARAKGLADSFEALGALCRDPNVDYLLLCDFPDASEREKPGEEALAALMRRRIAGMNARAGREKYHYLQRTRRYARADKLWRGHERKRGAVLALGALLIDGEDAQFVTERASAQCLFERDFHYVITLDADTRALPEAVSKLIGTIAHPLNRPRIEEGTRKGYALIAPRVEPGCAKTRFARLMAGPGGLDSYPVASSNLLMDACGRGAFPGKGIYDLQAFHQAALKLPDNAILSHDLIEGLLCGTGFACDVAVYDDSPGNLPGYLRRLERWTRGDWQLVRFVGMVPDALGKWMVLSNLARSLTAGAALFTLIAALWTANPMALAVGFAHAFLPALLPPSRAALRRGAATLALLPAESFYTLCGAARALYRQFRSNRGLLEWVPAADAEGAAGRDFAVIVGRTAAILTIPAFFNLAWLLPAAALATLFLIGPDWMHALAAPAPRPALPDDQREALTDLARATWRFFEATTPVDGPGLPPDNVQIDPPIEHATRTSPTNIGLYLLAVVSARILELIDEAQLTARLCGTAGTLEALDRWHGHLYNWYDTKTLKPLRPRYVSSVDSGNLAACLLTCASFVRGIDPALGARLEDLARGMDFTRLYDSSRNLFHIGFDAERGALSSGHYDLMASESRILSIVAMALHHAPIKHWSKLGRGMARAGRSVALISWSGTMFEYLMPLILMRAPEGSLLYETERAITRAQMAEGAPWGVSESGYNAFDLSMNYQYRAFGLPSLSLRGNAFERVISPYASMLALPVDPDAVMENLRVMQKSGFQGEMGLYEAIDYTPARLPEGEPFRVVASHMAHHQGMILAAIANALSDDALVGAFTRLPEVRALMLLLSEKPARGASRRAQSEPEPETARRQQGLHIACSASGASDAHLIYGCGTTAFLTASGTGFARARGVLMNRWTARRDGDDGLWVHVRLPARKTSIAVSGMCGRAANQRVRFEAGSATTLTRTDEIECRLTACISPEDGALIQRLELTSHAAMPIDLEVTGCFAVALCAQADMQAHPAFQNLFVRARFEDGALIYTRKPRSGEDHPMMMYALAGADGLPISHEIDLERLIGREGSLSDGNSLARSFSSAAGSTINPCAALRTRLTLAPGARRQLAFIAGVADDSAALAKMRARHMTGEDARRSLLLAGSQARSMLEFLGLSPARHQLLQRASLLLCFPTRSLEAPPVRIGISGLWALGISGDLPLITVRVTSTAQMGLVREALRTHEFYRVMGVWCDLVLINDYGNDYEQPVRDALRNAVGASHLSDMALEPGGAFPLEGASLSDAQRALIEAVSAVYLDGSKPLDTALRDALRAHTRPGISAPKARLRGGYMLPEEPRSRFNGWGGFTRGNYVIDLLPGKPTPAPWCNVLVNDGGFGSIISERGGGFTFAKNSRGGRLTHFTNDPLREGEGERLMVFDGRAYASLLPERRGLAQPFRVEHRPGASRFSSGTGTLQWTIDQFVDSELPAKCLMLTIHNGGGLARSLKLSASVDWLMGVGGDDARLTRAFAQPPLLMACGAMEGYGFAALLDARGDALTGLEVDPAAGLFAPLTLPPGGTAHAQLLVGWSPSAEGCKELLAAWGDGGARLERTQKKWEDLLSRLAPQTGDEILDQMLGRWLPTQALAGRIWGRVGFYQAGGAYGFRDQLQDMLSLISIEPSIVRAHILLCAAHQFESGDVQHWWHPERTGVRTRICDDLLFLPYVTAAYAAETGDRGILLEQIPYLTDVPLDEDQEDWYGAPEVSDFTESLHEHCLRAIRRAAHFGAHGLPLMGGGDWNDGMNRVGVDGGESVWLGQFLSVVADDYAQLCENPSEREELHALAASMREAVESHGWDGAWYRRAYYGDGTPLGSEQSEGGCRIDLIAQCWAVAAGLDPQRCKTAMDSAWDALYDEKHQLIKLLTPPFEEGPKDPGYIARYPAGVRENGGQYTHAACWAVMAFALMGDAERAWRALEALIPINHASTEEAALAYRVEPYVIAADVYGEPPFAGRGGWTWYTGAAGWLCRAAIRYLLGYERIGNRARLSALLHPQRDEAALAVKVGASVYTLRCRRGHKGVTLDGAPVAGEFIDLIDDGRPHEAIFPEKPVVTAGKTW